MTAQEPESRSATQRSGYEPVGPIPIAPVFIWPPRPVEFLRWMLGYPGYLWPWTTIFAAISLLTWWLLIPEPATFETVTAQWVLSLFVINAVMLVVVNSGTHIPLYVWKTQQMRYKYVARWLSTKSPRFLFGDQLWDNVFWSVASALPVWTAYEAFGFWLYANGHIPTVSWAEQPAYSVLLLVAIPAFAEVHFWLTHRLLHWPPLYKTVHFIHHKNVNVGPWSGLAMHPVEHLIYFSGAACVWLVPSHPLHFLFYLQYLALSAWLNHVGFHKIELLRKSSMATEYYMHYLHHKYLEVNYAADSLFPVDKWLGTFHDGTPESAERMKQRNKGRNIAETQ